MMHIVASSPVWTAVHAALTAAGSPPSVPVDGTGTAFTTGPVLGSSAVQRDAVLVTYWEDRVHWAATLPAQQARITTAVAAYAAALRTAGLTVAECTSDAGMPYLRVTQEGDQ